MRREIITWSIVAAVVVGGFVGTVAILNASLYSASGFVRSYLDALERHDAEGALELAGSAATGDASTELLVREAMGDLTDIDLVSDESDADGLHHVVYSWQADGVDGQSSFDVRRTGTLLGLFPTWEFESSPLAVMQLSVQHADSFEANGVGLVTPTQNQPAPYLVFVPGSYKLTHESTFLEAKPVVVTASAPGSLVPGTLDIQANEKFVTSAQQAINKALDECTTQTVLLPTGCPFGQPISNRIITEPKWSMLEYPDVTIQPGAQANTWRMPPATGLAHLVVDVKSLFDGAVTTLDEDVPFSVSYTVLILPGDKLAVSTEF